ncbi:transposase [Flavobacterium gawalongense]|uniref:Transposase n=1 Tax=Flavobacterium gawalongense TaxID=2594432 RepID=A0A553BH30_9FLAO|nr:transposase [Flavobacterium gawalongense]TRX00597.1 transposase [Flavobacterium gawalongense]TRX04691.1 transposase [Flavobacterium gawalongense]TRX07539.1 transposase [Flavobacterium gawalongense]TRX12962.1 transposase [Flavobacterium gawalongense]TRX31070.1 transposase [Flavobacterium gawalongense]
MDIRVQNLEPDCFYHIYNRGINSNKIFENQENYVFFLKQFSKYVLGICDVYGYCLMPNHFHFVLKIKSESKIKSFAKVPNFDKTLQNQGLHSFSSIASKQISKFISSYSQSYNKVNNRHGALLESPFKRKKIETEEYLRNLMIYIHQNPIELKIDFKTYKFSSYAAIVSKADTNIMRSEIIELFDDLDNFIFCHDKLNDFEF